MRIVFVHQDTCAYGASQSLLALLEGLYLHGHQFLVLLPQGGPLVEKLTAKGWDYRITSWNTWVSRQGTWAIRSCLSGLKNCAVNMAQLSKAARICAEFRPDVIHTNSGKTAFGAMLAKCMGIPHTWHFREFLGGPLSCGLDFSFGRYVSHKWIDSSTSAVITISDTLKAHQQFSLKNTSVHVVYNGVMSLKEMEELEAPLPFRPPLELALIGRFDHLKRPLVALETIKILRDQGIDVRLRMAGWGTDADVHTVKRFIDENQLSSVVELLGLVDDIGSVYRKSHVVLMCSVGDAFGRVTAEAMAYGRPVIGCRAGATSELITHGMNGLLFRRDDPHDLACQVRTLWNSNDFLDRLAKNAAAFAKRKFTTEEYAGVMEDVFAQAVRQCSKR